MIQRRSDAPEATPDQAPTVTGLQPSRRVALSGLFALGAGLVAAAAATPIQVSNAQSSRFDDLDDAPADRGSDDKPATPPDFVIVPGVDIFKNIPADQRFQHQLNFQVSVLDDANQRVTYVIIPGLVIAASATALTITPNDPTMPGGPFTINAQTVILRLPRGDNSGSGSGSSGSGKDGGATKTPTPTPNPRVGDKVYVVIRQNTTTALAIVIWTPPAAQPTRTPTKTGTAGPSRTPEPTRTPKPTETAEATHTASATKTSTPLSQQKSK